MIPWRKEGLLPSPVFWPREFHGLYSPWDHKESDSLLFLKEMLLFSTINCMLLVGFPKRLLKELKHLISFIYRYKELTITDIKSFPSPGIDFIIQFKENKYLYA